MIPARLRATPRSPAHPVAGAGAGRTTVRLAAALLSLAGAGAAFAQGGPASVTVPQLSSPGRDRVTSGPAETQAASALDRKERETLVDAGSIPTDARRSAEASPDLSTRAQGRAIGAAAIGGRDRCDSPASVTAQTELCRRRIEARAGDYAKPGAAPVTAEGRLLVLSEPPMAPQSLDSATRRLGGAAPVDALAGSAAAQLAGAIDPQRAGSAAPATATGTGAAASALPAGLPPSVVFTPR